MKVMFGLHAQTLQLENVKCAACSPKTMQTGSKKSRSEFIPGSVPKTGLQVRLWLRSFFAFRGCCTLQDGQGGSPSFPALATKEDHITKCSRWCSLREILSRLYAPMAFGAMQAFQPSPV